MFLLILEEISIKNIEPKIQNQLFSGKNSEFFDIFFNSKNAENVENVNKKVLVELRKVIKTAETLGNSRTRENINWRKL